MSNEKSIEQIYELIELFDYEELTQKQKEFVLLHITRKEYENMRSTIADTKELFAKYPETIKTKGKSSFKKILTFPLELYKVAAIVIILFGIGVLFSKMNSTTNQTNIFSNDTVFMTIIDTLFIEKIDTVEIVKNQIVYKNKEQKTNNFQEDSPIYAEYNYPKINEFNVNPDDIDVINKLKTNGNLSQDSALSDFVVTVN
ncbi:MAG: hypothetical protein JXL97_11540 [Bacteroidales bacterium]|nr:hypothetical protein [Bacteroidales bacterium]